MGIPAWTVSTRTANAVVRIAEVSDTESAIVPNSRPCATRRSNLSAKRTIWPPAPPIGDAKKRTKKNKQKDYCRIQVPFLFFFPIVSNHLPFIHVYIRYVV